MLLAESFTATVALKQSFSSWDRGLACIGGEYWSPRSSLVQPLAETWAAQFESLCIFGCAGDQ